MPWPRQDHPTGNLVRPPPLKIEKTTASKMSGSAMPRPYALREEPYPAYPT